ncbi:hypothetical protein IW262DRAFT_525401 [Armillaria fumosa]|nr:hypothetical protein IW262DRAFT_525401 [Armillaria fumosa]
MPNLGIGITAVMSTVVADSAVIWHCWEVWRQRCVVVVCPILCLVTGFVFKILEISEAFLYGLEHDSFLVIYISCILATTLWCTLSIILRILIIIQAKNGAAADSEFIATLLKSLSSLRPFIL